MASKRFLMCRSIVGRKNAPGGGDHGRSHLVHSARFIAHSLMPVVVGKTAGGQFGSFYPHTSIPGGALAFEPFEGRRRPRSDT